MGRAAFEGLKREHRSLLLLATLLEEKDGLSANDIAQRIEDATGERSFYSTTIQRLIREVNSWAEQDFGVQKIIERVEGRIPLYRVSPELNGRVWDDLLGVAFAILLLRHGKPRVVSLMRQQERHISNVMYLLQSLERKKMVSVLMTNGVSFQLFCPWKVMYGNGAWRLYGWHSDTGNVDDVPLHLLKHVALDDRSYEDNETAIALIENIIGTM